MSALEGPHYTPSPVELENVVGAWTAANTRGGLSLAGGKVLLTSRYLVFTPWDMDETRAWLMKALSTAGFSYAEQLDKLITASKLLEPVVVPLDSIGSVEPLNRAGLLRPPTVRLELTGGGHFDLGILDSPTTWNGSSRNDFAMEQFIGRLQPLIGR